MKRKEITKVYKSGRLFLDELKNAFVYADEFGTPLYDSHMRAVQMLNVTLLCKTDSGKTIPMGRSYSENGTMAIYQIGDDADKRHAFVDVEDGYVMGLKGIFMEDDGQFDFEMGESGTRAMLDAVLWVTEGKKPKFACRAPQSDWEAVPQITDFGKIKKYRDVEYDKEFFPTDIEYAEMGTLHARTLFWKGYEEEMEMRKKHGNDWRVRTKKGRTIKADTAIHRYCNYLRWAEISIKEEISDPRWSELVGSIYKSAVFNNEMTLATKKSAKSKAGMLLEAISRLEEGMELHVIDEEDPLVMPGLMQVAEQYATMNEMEEEDMISIYMGLLCADMAVNATLIDSINGHGKEESLIEHVERYRDMATV